jgi:sulfite reductase (NADPH) flavoprotein alpha-component
MDAQGVRLGGLRYGVLALGDRGYPRFCAFGHALASWLDRHQAKALFDTVEVDNGNASALHDWQNRLSALDGSLQIGSLEIADPQTAHGGKWTLRTRTLLNPGSVGAPAFHLGLVSDDPALMAWEAGDIAEVRPCHPSRFVEQWLRDLSLDGTVTVKCNGTTMSLTDALATRRRPPFPTSSIDARQCLSPQALVDSLALLPHRAHSISSLPVDGQLELLVRQTRDPDASCATGYRVGLASGWLTEHASPSSMIALRIRRNHAFHAPPSDCPLILIGNGTGLAGLRAHLKERVKRGHRRNWLLFGERSESHDAFHANELAQWRNEGVLARLDLVRVCGA